MRDSNPRRKMNARRRRMPASGIPTEIGGESSGWNAGRSLADLRVGAALGNSGPASNRAAISRDYSTFIVPTIPAWVWPGNEHTKG